MKKVLAFIGAGILAVSADPARAEGVDAAPIAFHVDNDLFSGRSRDEDYSWGVSATFKQTQNSAWQTGVIAMTPRELTIAAPLAGERPYASLVYVTRAQLRVDPQRRRARYTSASLGALGLNVAHALQSTLHDAIGGDVPRGWQHQISDGGELTARLLHAHHWLLEESDTSQLKMTLSASAGYLSETAAAIAWRGGHLGSDWWTHSPELTDYTPAPMPRSSRNAPAESFFFAGVRVKARAYSALLQGQFRHSDVRVASDDVARVLGEAWVGATHSWKSMRMTYTLRVSTREIDSGPAARTLIWGGLEVEKVF
jgi:hypothetical protein